QMARSRSCFPPMNPRLSFSVTNGTGSVGGAQAPSHEPDAPLAFGHALPSDGRAAAGETGRWLTFPMPGHPAVASSFEPNPQFVGNERSIRTRFTVPMHAKNRKEAPHEPPHPRPLPGWQLATRVRSLAPLSGGVGRGYIAGERFQMAQGTLQVPECKGL